MTAAGMGASPDAGSASLSSSGSVSTSSSAAGKMDASVGDTCAYFAPIEGESCSRRRRSCYDCLNVEIASEKYVRFSCIALCVYGLSCVNSCC